MSKQKALEQIMEKIQNLQGEEEEEEVPECIKRRVEALEKLHLDVHDIDVEYKKERAALEAKYHVRREVIYSQRTKIVTGEVDVPAPEGAKTEEDEIKGVTGFWLRALINHPAIGDYITEEDAGALECLTNISVEYNEDYSSFKVIFHFAENAFFSNATLEKTYKLEPDVLEDKSPTLLGAVGTTINWKTSKNLTVNEIKKKQKAKSGKNKGQTRTITILEPKASFFHYFADTNPDEGKYEEEEDAEDDEEEDNKFKIGVEEDYDIAHALRSEVVPDAVKWFTGEAVPEDAYDFDGEDEEDDEEGEGEDDDEDDDDEDDDEEEEVDTKKKNSKKPAAAAASANGEQPECKQN